MASLKSRQEFYDAVCVEARKGSLSMSDAYEAVERKYRKAHHQRRYANYDAFYHSNYNALFVGIQQRAIRAQFQDEFFKLCEKQKQGEITSVEMYRIIEDKLLRMKLK